MPRPSLAAISAAAFFNEIGAFSTSACCGVDLPPEPSLRACHGDRDDTDRFDALLTVLERAIDLVVVSDRDAHRPVIAALCCEAAALSGAWAEPSR